MDLVIVFNNYLHDLATGVFFGAAVALWAIARSAAEDEAAICALTRVFRALQITLWVSLVWILLGGVPRALYFPDFEFIPALGKGLIPALVIKHVIMVTAVGIGLVGWWQARRALRSAESAGVVGPA